MPPQEPFPLVTHYGLLFHVNDYAFDKLWLKGTRSFTKCHGRVFMEVPSVDTLTEPIGSHERRRKEIALYTMQMLRDSQLAHHKQHCDGISYEEEPLVHYSCTIGSNLVESCKKQKPGDPPITQGRVKIRGKLNFLILTIAGRQI